MKLLFNSITFSYPDSNNVFENNSLSLEFQSKFKHNLYGIIGPSGTGKTTFVSIAGGQLKPNHGDVIINDQNIYTVDDRKRRKLISLQMQASTALRGNVKYNTTFGLPVSNSAHEELFGDLNTTENRCSIKDAELIDVLEKVGLWKLFDQKQGLETLIGENGLTLSGGQKQRLNFANLYLRAQHYHPSLILIDEPTSSLDEISENTITDLILELSQSSLVLVVAHRIKTLEKANGLFDSSLIKPNTDLSFLPPQELLTKSPYFSALLSGKAQLDSD